MASPAAAIQYNTVVQTAHSVANLQIGSTTTWDANIRGNIHHHRHPVFPSLAYVKQTDLSLLKRTKLHIQIQRCASLLVNNFFVKADGAEIGVTCPTVLQNTAC